ncbi:hypothetical protein ZWY2020_058624, partial [Hordeum vulgare]
SNAFILHRFLGKSSRKTRSKLGRSFTGQSPSPSLMTSYTEKVFQASFSGVSLLRRVEHGEGLQVLHYEVGQKYESHFHYFLDGQRMETILMYLSDVEEGGETIFPDANVNSSSLPWYNELSECARKDLAVKPNMGDALLFWSMKPDATLDPLSLHGDCPVIKGNKWSSTKWLHVGEYKA